jgi:hypothetical protein
MCRIFKQLSSKNSRVFSTIFLTDSITGFFASVVVVFSCLHNQTIAIDVDVNATLRMYVVTLQGVPGAAADNEHRFDSFVADWTAQCGSRLDIRRCAGALDSRQGYGLTKAFVDCFRKAERENAPNNVALFFEDDARLMPPLADNRLCESSSFLVDTLWPHMPNDTSVLLLGGWQMRFPASPKIHWRAPFVPLIRSWGS